MRYKGVGLVIFSALLLSLISIFSSAEFGGGGNPYIHTVCCKATDVYGGTGGTCNWVTTNNSCQDSVPPIYYPMGPNPPCASWLQGQDIWAVINSWSAYHYTTGENYGCDYGCAGNYPTECATPYGYNLCTNLDNDNNNCGSCGNDCESGESCINGVCTLHGGGGGSTCFDCTINTVKVLPGPGCSGNNCGKGDKLIINITYDPVTCHYGCYIDTKGIAFASAWSTDYSCIINNTNADIDGMCEPNCNVNDYGITHASGITTFEYTLPTIPIECNGKTIIKTRGGLTALGTPPLDVCPNLQNGGCDEMSSAIYGANTNIKLIRCGDGFLDLDEQCDAGGSSVVYNSSFDSCSDFGYSSGTVSCNPGTCQVVTSACKHTIENVAYAPTFTPTTQGCNPDLKICGRNGIVNVSLRVNNLDNTASGTYVDTTVKSDITTGGECIIYDMDYTASAPDNNGYINYTYNVNPNLFNNNPAACYNKTVNNTIAALKESGPSGNIKSNVYGAYSPGFRLNECGDGQLDTIAGNPPYIEKCDYNLTTHSWMTTSCTALGQGFTGGVATCNQVSCQWNTGSCYRCGDGVKDPNEECDLGAANSNYGRCNMTCQWTKCGDHRYQSPNGVYLNGTFAYNPYVGYNTWGFETCDDGNSNQFDTCANNCTRTFCGDNRIQSPNGMGQNGTFVWDCEVQPCVQRWGYELCDDGNLVNTDLCNGCVKTFCGDNIPQWPNGEFKNGTRQYYPPEDRDMWGFEQCDDGNPNQNDECYNNCTLTFCGDGIQQEPNGVRSGGPNNNGYEQCDGTPGCSADCILMSCGNGIVESGEECDDGGRCSNAPLSICSAASPCPKGGICIPQSGDGCSASCKLTDCNIEGISLDCPGGVCGKDDPISVSVDYVGTSCYKANLIQIDYTSDSDILCRIEFNPDGNEMQGMNSTFVNTGRSPFNYNYVVPSVPDACAGESLNFVTSAFYEVPSGGGGSEEEGGGMGIGGSTPAWILRSDYYYTSNVEATLFDQCKEFGAVTNYVNYGVDLGYDVITNANTGCYYHTCNDYDATPVNMLVNDERKIYGVELFNTLQNKYVPYYCDVLVEDFVCPDEFEYLGMCKQGESQGGVCASHSVKDADCEIKTPMKCGLAWNGTTYISTCRIPLPPVPLPVKYCSDASMCVYANESTGQNKTCVSAKGTVKNAINKTIVCSNNNTWCPLGYTFNGTHCQNLLSQCVEKCADVVEVAWRSSDPENLKRTTVWRNYLNDSDCFMTNTTTARRRAYCGVGYVWPELNYHYLPIGVAYWKFDIGTGNWTSDTDEDPAPVFVDQ